MILPYVYSYVPEVAGLAMPHRHELLQRAVRLRHTEEGPDLAIQCDRLEGSKEEKRKRGDERRRRRRRENEDEE